MKDLLKSITASVRKNRPLLLTGAGGSLPSALAALAAQEAGEAATLVVVPDQEEAEATAEEMSFFSSVERLVYPPHDTLPFIPMLPSKERMAQRMAVLHRLLEGWNGAVVAPVQALLEPVPPAEVLGSEWEYLRRGMVLDRDHFINWLHEHGYDRVAVVQSKGEFAVRGEIIDLFPPGAETPVRIDLFDEEIEAIRSFDPDTQRSMGPLEELTVLPADEMIYTKELVDGFKGRLIRAAEERGWSSAKVHSIMTATESHNLGEWQRSLFPIYYPNQGWFIDYLQGARVVVLHRERCLEEAESYRARLEKRYHEAEAEQRVLSPLSTFILGQGHLKDLMDSASLVVADLPGHGQSVDLASTPMDTELIPVRSAVQAVSSRTLETVASWIEQGERVVFQAYDHRTANRIVELLKLKGIVDEIGIEPSPPPCPLDIGAGIHLFIGPLRRGFSWGDLRLISQTDLLGGVKRAPKRRRRRATLRFEELSPGDLVVHRSHGIGRYRGLESMEIGGVQGEFLLIEYRGGDKLYLPVHRLNSIERYMGTDDREPPLDRLGGKTWAAKTEQVKRAIREIAHELVELYAKRKIRQGFAFTPPDELYQEFEASFPYEETPDQFSSIEEIIEDMTSPRPMDRLLCGDVGYGKTEVAMRAAFLAVKDKKQVAVLVPTTLLAEQHERTFKARFARFPVEIAALSRLKSRREQREIIARIKEHRVDIVIGTHRLLQSDVIFADLGLIIVDEEHRFGVRHKERLKRLKEEVDCLTLTATPIPRTLQLSLLGVRDLSVINTPPQERQPITTYLAAFDESIIAEAVSREMERNGQVYLVHNRISGLERLAALVKRLVPEARVETAHGQMEPAMLEEVMIRFVRRQIDCLVCTTIIESGLDIPSANTIIINRADLLGLADLYQLRGRVGRSEVAAFAYLLVPSLEAIHPDARKRLRAVMEMTSHGGGFKLAMKDLQLRGAGNILGTSQSGQIAKVGYEMYLELLQAAVEELKGVPRRRLPEPEINLRVPAYIPEEYVADVSERLRIYRRISCSEKGEEEALKGELEDRFGPIPAEVDNLFLLLEIKRLLMAMNGARCDGDPCSKVAIAFHPPGPPQVERLVSAVSQRRDLGITPDERLIFTPSKVETGENGLLLLIKVLRELQEGTNKD